MTLCSAKSPHQKLPCDLPSGHADGHRHKLTSTFWTDVKPEDQSPPDVDWLDCIRPTYPGDEK